jgi:hypothetical protein
MFSVYVDGYIRGTRRIGIKEARSISNALRREYPKMFAVSTESGLTVLILPWEKRNHVKRSVADQNTAHPAFLTPESRI